MPPSTQQSSVQRPVAILTGAGSGIGRAAARLLAVRGWRCFLVGRREEALLETGSLLGARWVDWTFESVDITDDRASERVAEGALQAFGRIDALINNAGWSPLRPIDGATPAEIRSIFEINAIAPIALTAACWPTFMQQGAGCVVNVSSFSTIDPFPGLGVYGAAKAAMNILARAVVTEAEDAFRAAGRSGGGVRAFAVAPGAVETPLLRSLFDESVLPRARTLSPEDVGEVIVACVLGEQDEQMGTTILVPSP